MVAAPDRFTPRGDFGRILTAWSPATCVPIPPPAPAAPSRSPDGSRSGPDGDDDTTGPGWGTWASAGVDFGVSVVLFFLLGSWLDAKWGTSPWMRVAGAGFGVILGMYLLIRKALTANAKNPDRIRGKGSEVPPKDGPPRT